jgi:hypothetical protein
MNRPKINDVIFNDPEGYTDMTKYSEGLDKYIEHLEIMKQLNYKTIGGVLLRLFRFSSRRKLLIDFLDDVLMCQDEGATIVDREKYVDGYLKN